MRTILIGAVKSTEIALLKLIEHRFDLVGIYGYESENTDHISGYTNLENHARSAKLPYSNFRNINDHSDEIKQLNPDIIFVVGLSQLVSESIVNAPRLCCVGFHPTHLPHGRGRAPLAWLIHRQESGAATFFQIDKGVDDGPIFVQTPFSVDVHDDAEAVSKKIHVAMESALNKWLPDLLRHGPHGIPQNDADATYYAKRARDDGLIRWDLPATSIDILVKATTRPYPGAYTFINNSRVVVWKSRIENQLKIHGVSGRIVHLKKNRIPVIQTGDGLLELLDYEHENSDFLRVGDKLGFYPELEIYELKRELNQQKQLIEQLLHIQKNTNS